MVEDLFVWLVGCLSVFWLLLFCCLFACWLFVGCCCCRCLFACWLLSVVVVAVFTAAAVFVLYFQQLMLLGVMLVSV